MRSGYSWAWNGRKNNGDSATVGYYNIKISATVSAAPGSTRSVVRQVHLTTGYVIKTATKLRTGHDTSSTSHSGSCYVDHDYYYDTVDLDCWNGSYAKARYGFSIPSSAYNISWGVTGYQGCCSGGSISKTGTRPTSTYYRGSVKVTDWRSYTVEKVRITYKYKRRI